VAKLALVLAMARFMTDHQKQVLSEHRFGGSFKYGVLFPGMMIGLIGILIAAERHISGLMIIGIIGISMMFLGGTRLRWIFAIAGAVIGAGCLLVLVSEYAQARVETWLFIEQADPLGEAWQTLQGLMAIGSGGFFGVGLGNSRQKFGYVSQPQNDFIFTIVCEELGFIGAMLVIGLFIAFVWRGFRIARSAPDRYSSLVVYGLVFKVALQTIFNIAVVTNSMPNTGIALPFFSYGGTSLMLQIFEVGIILSISRYCSHEKI
jgi:cell division protein FtsW